MRRMSTARRKGIALPGEKTVRPKGKIVPVKPARGKAEEPMPDAAIDRRRQFVQTDEPRKR